MIDRSCDAYFGLNAKTKPYSNEYGEYDCPSEYAEWVCFNKYEGVVVGMLRVRGARHAEKIKVMVCGEHGHLATKQEKQVKGRGEG